MKKSYEYRNEFLYFVIRADESRRKGSLVYCSGVNISRFFPVTRGRHGIGTNPAMRGLQLVNLHVRDMALSQGATPKRMRGNDCAGLVPTDETWYTELLLIEDAPESFPEEMIDYCVTNLLRKIFKAVLLEAPLPERLLNPDELQVFLDSLCRICTG